MNRVLSLYLVALAILVVPSGAAANDDRSWGTASFTKTEQVATTKKVTKALQLPNVTALTQALWKADRKILPKQRWKSASVLTFYRNHQWLLAPNKEKCWEVPWQRTCTVARASHRLHTALAQIATRRLLYELPTPNDWVTSVHLIQRVFPGTESWLLSCSGAEGGHGRFVVYGGGSYYPGAEYAKTFHGDMVGGPMQYMWDTFKGHYRRGLDALRARGFKIKLPHPTDVRAWLSPTAQAIAAGWARWSGNDDSHWSASFGNGC